MKNVILIYYIDSWQAHTHTQSVYLPNLYILTHTDAFRKRSRSYNKISQDVDRSQNCATNPHSSRLVWLFIYHTIHFKYIYIQRGEQQEKEMKQTNNIRWHAQTEKARELGTDTILHIKPSQMSHLRSNDELVSAVFLHCRLLFGAFRFANIFCFFSFFFVEFSHYDKLSLQH